MDGPLHWGSYPSSNHISGSQALSWHTGISQILKFFNVSKLQAVFFSLYEERPFPRSAHLVVFHLLGVHKEIVREKGGYFPASGDGKDSKTLLLFTEPLEIVAGVDGGKSLHAILLSRHFIPPATFSPSG